MTSMGVTCPCYRQIYAGARSRRDRQVQQEIRSALPSLFRLLVGNIFLIGFNLTCDISVCLQQKTSELCGGGVRPAENKAVEPGNGHDNCVEIFLIKCFILMTGWEDHV
jgi:hypothetical protein